MKRFLLLAYYRLFPPKTLVGKVRLQFLRRGRVRWPTMSLRSRIFRLRMRLGLPVKVWAIDWEKSSQVTPEMMRLVQAGLGHEMCSLKVHEDTRTNEEIDAEMEQTMVRLGLQK